MNRQYSRTSNPQRSTKRQWQRINNKYKYDLTQWQYANQRSNVVRNLLQSNNKAKLIIDKAEVEEYFCSLFEQPNNYVRKDYEKIAD